MEKEKKQFSEIYDTYIDKIYRFIFLKVNSEEIAQDLCSETFIKGWEAFRNNKIDNIQAFLYQIARNQVIDHYREKGRTQMVSVDKVAIEDDKLDLNEQVALNSDIEQIKVVLTNLKEDYQNVIIWRYLDDLPMKEVAKLMNKSEETTRVTLHRALKSLKKELENRTA